MTPLFNFIIRHRQRTDLHLSRRELLTLKDRYEEAMRALHLLGRRIRLSRKVGQLSQKQLAMNADITLEQLCRIEAGEELPDDGVMLRILNGYDVAAHDS